MKNDINSDERPGFEGVYGRDLVTNNLNHI